MRKSKMIQFADRVLEILVAQSPNKDMCVVYLTERHFHKIPAGPFDMASTCLQGGGTFPPPPPPYRIKYIKRLRLFVGMAGWREKDFSHFL